MAVRLKQRPWFTLEQAASYLNQISEEPAISEMDLIQYAIEGNLKLSLHFFSSHVFAVPGELVPPNEAEVKLSHISDFVFYCDLETREVLHRGRTYIIEDGDLPEECEDAARAVILGQKLEEHEQEALNHIGNSFPDKPDGRWIFDFAGERLTGSDYDFILETAEHPVLISETWDIAEFYDVKPILELTWKYAKERPNEPITRLQTPQDGSLRLVHEDGVSCAVVAFAELAQAEESLLCVRPENLNALFEAEHDEDVEAHERPKLKSEVQKAAILDTLRNQLKIDPLNLPERPEGRNRGAKAHCWEILKSNRQLFTRNSFEDAWKTLRKNKQIMGG